MAEKSPFHITIAGAIRRCETKSELRTLGELILMTKVPENHDVITTAWQESSKRLGYSGERVVASLLNQKDEAEAEAPRCPKCKAKFTKQNPETSGAGLCRECHTGGAF